VAIAYAADHGAWAQRCLAFAGHHRGAAQRMAARVLEIAAPR
jgi:hypothetical protein